MQFMPGVTLTLHAGAAAATLSSQLPQELDRGPHPRLLFLHLGPCRLLGRLLLPLPLSPLVQSLARIIQWTANWLRLDPTTGWPRGRAWLVWHQVALYVISLISDKYTVQQISELYGLWFVLLCSFLWQLDQGANENWLRCFHSVPGRSELNSLSWSQRNGVFPTCQHGHYQSENSPRI